MRLLCTLVFAFAAFPQSVPLKDRVLILVNDRVPESVSVGQYYAAKRNIPAANILHLKTLATEQISQEEFKDQIENPVRKFLDANGGAMRKKILYIVPTYGVPVKIAQQFAVDSVLVMMYAGHEDQKPPLRNPYSAPTGSRPPHFAEWSDGVAAANNFKMFAVTRLDGPSAEIAKGLVDKAIQAETSLTLTSGIAYFDSQGTRHPDEWQYDIDEEIKAASELSRKAGFHTVLNVQAGALCGSMFPPPPQYLYDAANQRIAVNAQGATAAAAWAFPPVPEGDLTFQVAEGGVQNTGNSITLTLGSSSDKSRVRLFYPFVPYKQWNTSDEIVLEKTVDGVVAARIAVPVKNDEKVMNQFGALRLSVRNTRLAVYRDGVEIAAVEDKSGKPPEPGKSLAERQLLGFLHQGPDRDRCRRRAGLGRQILHRQHGALPVANFAASRTQRLVGLGMVRRGFRRLPLCARRRGRPTYLLHRAHASAPRSMPTPKCTALPPRGGEETGCRACWSRASPQPGEPSPNHTPSTTPRAATSSTIFGPDTTSATASTSPRTPCAG